MPKLQKLSSIVSDPQTFILAYGGWYQRTTLHLSEIYEFLAKGSTYLDLDKDKVRELWKRLGVVKVTRELGYLEYILVTTRQHITIKYYEDGLYVLSTQTDNVEHAQQELDEFFQSKFNPAISYIFSLGAPTPKVLANIKTVHPTAILAYDNVSLPACVTNIYSTIASNGVTVVKAKDYIFILVNSVDRKIAEGLMEMQIFFREFKDQLERYLNIHRKIWEEIADIRERKSIRVKELSALRNKLDSYQKTINLISNRINQMSSYVRTRKSIAQQIGVDQNLVSLFQYRFEALMDTLDYIKEIWKMTSDYVVSAIQVIVEAQSAVTNRSIQSLTLITSVGVIAGLVVHLARDSFPKITPTGLVYLVILLILGWCINTVVQKAALNKKQTLKFMDLDSKL